MVAAPSPPGTRTGSASAWTSAPPRAPPRSPAVRATHAQPRQSRPAPGTSRSTGVSSGSTRDDHRFMFLNVNAPPFNDLRVRQAVNLALDRRLVVATSAVRSRPGRPARSCLPALAGYRRYCPYTRDSGGRGRWHGPDLARASAGRRLRHGRDEGHRLERPPRPRAPSTRPETPWRRSASSATGPRCGGCPTAPTSPTPRLPQSCPGHRRRLERRLRFGRRLHRQAHLQLLRPRQRPRPPATPASSATRPGPADRPGRRPATTDPQPRPPVARLDRQLTDLAILLTTVTPNEIDLLSQPRGQLPVQPGLGSAHRPALGPLIPVSDFSTGRRDGDQSVSTS